MVLKHREPVLQYLLRILLLGLQLPQGSGVSPLKQLLYLALCFVALAKLQVVELVQLGALERELLHQLAAILLTFRYQIQKCRQFPFFDALSILGFVRKRLAIGLHKLGIRRLCNAHFRDLSYVDAFSCQQNRTFGAIIFKLVVNAIFCLLVLMDCASPDRKRLLQHKLASLCKGRRLLGSDTRLKFDPRAVPQALLI